MSNIKLKFSVVSLLCGLIFFSCSKDKFTPIEIDKLNPDTTAYNTALDMWLRKTFLDEYNINVIYRNHIYYHEVDRNITPPDPKNVQPTMTNVLNGFLLPYRKVAGDVFIKKSAPREFVLWGSPSYTSKNEATMADASGGIRVNIYNLDDYSSNTSSVVNIIHHEFVHILNQKNPMPADFEKITAANYNTNWTATDDDTARKYGFVSQYSTMNPKEDFAETAATLLVFGQTWFDNRVKTSSLGASALRQKEASVVSYYSNIGVDFRALQKEVQLYVKDTLKNQVVTFPYWLNQGNMFSSLTVDLSDIMHNQYGQSSAFASEYQKLKDSVALISRTVTSFQLTFTKKDSMTLSISYLNASGASVTVDNDFAMKINVGSRTVQFVKVKNKAGKTYDNNSPFGTIFNNTIFAYLTSRTFIGDWLPNNISADMYMKTAGFYVQGSPDNYFYGNLNR